MFVPTSLGEGTLLCCFLLCFRIVGVWAFSLLIPTTIYKALVCHHCLAGFFPFSFSFFFSFFFFPLLLSSCCMPSYDFPHGVQ